MNALEPIEVIYGGKVMDFNTVHPSNACSPIAEQLYCRLMVVRAVISASIYGEIPGRLGEM